MLTFIFWLLMTASAHAATLYWNGPIDGTVDIERKGEDGRFAFVDRVNANPPRYTLPKGVWGEYKLTFPGGESNTVTYSADLDGSGGTDRLDALEAKLAGICRAAKAMGGTATTLAGRLRKEIPC